MLRKCCRPKHAIAIIIAMAFMAMPAPARREVKMEIRGPGCGVEISYCRTSEGGKKQETYFLHAEELNVRGEPAYQSISVFDDRVRRITMRQSDLTPIAASEKWYDGSKLVLRTYARNKVRVIRRNLPYPMDMVVEVPPGVHDPESFAFLLKGYPFEEQDAISPISVLVAEDNALYMAVFGGPRTFDVYIEPRGEETITVPAGTFDCYVLEMSLRGILGYIVPDNRFWLLKEDPHLVVKAVGAGEMIELVDGPWPCDGVDHCAVKAEVPEPWQ